MERYVASLLGSAALALVGIPGAHAASVPFINPQSCQIPAACIDLNNTMQGSVNPSVVGFGALTFGKNFLDNGDMFMHARGTSVVTGATTAGCAVTNYVADRWCVQVDNSGAGAQGQVLTTAPTPPLGFQNEMIVVRATGTVVSPICTLHEIETARAVQLQGKPAILSTYLFALTGAPTSMTVTGYVFMGTGTDQGLGSLRGAVGMVNATSLFPNWTGISVLPVQLIVQPTTGWQRFTTSQIPIATSETELGVAFCFTPGGETANTSDGFAFTGAQLEMADGNQVAASQFEFQPPFVDVFRSQRYYQQITEQTGIPLAIGYCSASAVEYAGLQLGTPMQFQPTLTFTAGGFKWNVNSVTPVAVSALVIASSVLSLFGTTSELVINDTATCASNQTVVLIGSAATGKFVLSADF